MKKSLLLLALALSPISTLASSLMPQENFCVVTKGTDGLTPMATLVQKLGDTLSHGVAGDIGMALSIATIRDAILTMKPDSLCASAVVFDKNIYLYHTYLITYVLKFDNGADRVIPVLFQAASVQAYHGIGKAPWMGIAKADLESLARKEFANLEFEAVGKASLRKLMDRALGVNANSDTLTTSLVPLFQEGENSYFLATEMVPLQSGNPYLTVNAARALAIKEDSQGNLSVAKFNPLFGFYAQLAELVNATVPAEKTYAAQKAKLIEISK